MNLAARLSAARAALDLSQTLAARRLGVNVRTYQGWESGRCEQSVAARQALASLLAAPSVERELVERALELLGDASLGDLAERCGRARGHLENALRRADAA